jgi:purine-nucleoside phosphorylase
MRVRFFYVPCSRNLFRGITFCVSRMHLITECARHLQQRFGKLPRLAIVLGSGFQPILANLKILKSIPWAEFPDLPEISVEGHVPQFVLALLEEQPVFFVGGRVHYYETGSIQHVTFPIRVLAAAGIKDLVLTSAAGGINQNYGAGEFMLLKDHINFMGVNPLLGYQGPNRFLDLSRVYSPELNRFFREAAAAAGITVHEGTYIGVSGPSYETPAEINAFRNMGADIVGMSTVPEAIVARQQGMSVAAFSCITNPAAGVSNAPLNHAEVLSVAANSTGKALNLLAGFTSRYFARTGGENELRNSPKQLPSTLP